jgi:hypothetical protein
MSALVPPLLRGVKICVTPVTVGIGLSPYFVILPEDTPNLHLALELHLLQQLFSRAPPFDHPFIVSLVLAVPQVISLDVLHVRVEFCPCPLHRLNFLPVTAPAPAVALPGPQAGAAAAVSRPSTNWQPASRPTIVSRHVVRLKSVPQPSKSAHVLVSEPAASQPVPQQPSQAVTKQFICDVCGRAHLSRGGLHQHMRIHSRGDAQFPCTVCSSIFHMSWRLVKHMRNHTLPFVCECGSRFSSSHKLTAHQEMQKHSGGSIDASCADSGCRLTSETVAAKDEVENDPGQEEYVP